MEQVSGREAKEKMNLISYSKFALLVMMVLGLTPLRDQKPPGLNGEVRELLVRMKGNHRSTELAVLFEIGDNNIADLITALRDPDKEVSLSAQIVIRYLGNEQGMNAWGRMYKTNLQVPLTGPIPIPLSVLDYDFARTQYLKPKVIHEPLMDAYLFALALDGSPQATQLLSAIIANANKHGSKLIESRYLMEKGKIISEETDLAAQVLQRASVLDPVDREATTAKAIAYSAAKDKVLVEIHVNRGTLSQEWYHIVLKRVARGWTTFSITQVAVS